MTFKVPLGFDSDRKEYVSPVNALKGISYYCASCEHFLVFKDGAIKVKHFAHKYEGECNYDNFVHTLAQKVILDSSDILINEGEVVQYSNPRKEVVIGDHRVDAVIDANGHKGLLVEIVVSSPLSDEKLKALEAHNLLEIKLSNLEQFTSMQAFIQLVLYDKSNRNLHRKTYITSPNSDKESWYLVGGIAALMLALWRLSRHSKRKRY